MKIFYPRDIDFEKCLHGEVQEVAKSWESTAGFGSGDGDLEVIWICHLLRKPLVWGHPRLGQGVVTWGAEEIEKEEPEVGRKQGERMSWKLQEEDNFKKERVIKY